MKVLKTALLILLIGIVIYIGIALIAPPISNTIDTTVEKPTNLVYSILSSPSPMEQWMPGLESVEHIKGLSNSIGSEYLFTFEIEGYKIPINVTLDNKILNESIKYNIQHENIISEIDINTLSNSNHTNLIINYNIIPNGILTKIAFPLIKPMVKEYVKESEDNIIDLIKSF